MPRGIDIDMRNNQFRHVSAPSMDAAITKVNMWQASNPEFDVNIQAAYELSGISHVIVKATNTDPPPASSNPILGAVL